LPAARPGRSCFPRLSRRSRRFWTTPGPSTINAAQARSRKRQITHFAMPKLQTVHVRVNDAATGKPTPCRVRFTDAQGTYYAPFGRLTGFSTARGQDVGGNVQTAGKAFAYMDGSCE